MLGRLRRSSRAFRATLRKERQLTLLRSQLTRHGIAWNDRGFLLSHGIGDHLIAMGFANAYERTHGEPLCCFVGRAGLAFLSDLFLPRRPYVVLPEGVDATAFEDGVRRTRLLYTHFPGHHLASAIGYRGLTLMDAHRCRLELPPDTDPEPPTAPSPSDVEQAEALLTDRKAQPGRTIMLCTEARSLDSSGWLDCFWTPLAARLRAEGFDIAVNDNPTLTDRLSLPHRDPLPLNQWRAAIAACGHVITFRSGLSDLAVNTGARHTVIFPPIRFNQAPIIRDYPVADAGLSNDVLQVEIDPCHMDGVISAVVGHHRQGQANAEQVRRAGALARSDTKAAAGTQTDLLERQSA